MSRIRNTSNYEVHHTQYIDHMHVLQVVLTHDDDDGHISLDSSSSASQLSTSVPKESIW